MMRFCPRLIIWMELVDPGAEANEPILADPDPDDKLP
jgi:hypothetical protein